MRRHLIGAVVAVFLSFPGCSPERKGEVQVLAKINDFELSLEAFERQLKEEVELVPDFKATRGARGQFLEELIRKELLVQEAKRRRLDHRERFVRTIERYWEATLIKDLMEEKGAEIAERTMVPEEEVEARYRALRASEPDLSRDPKIRDRIMRELLEDKKSRVLEEWVRGLRQEAKVEIHQGLLQGK